MSGLRFARGSAKGGKLMQDCCFTCKNLEYRKNYVYPYRCLKHKAERFSEDECVRRVKEVYKCDKYEEADLDDYCSRGEKKGATE